MKALSAKVAACLIVMLWIATTFAQNISDTELDTAIASRLMKVDEFKFIRETAERMGIRVWLFGGTAAGYGHYVKWDLLREKGDTRFQKDRFDYDYSNIYRSTQDADIVIDGSSEQAEQLESALKKALPHLEGSKKLWEVRLLSEKRDDKDALLNNPDYLKQHTDSNSTGMIEVTKPPIDESVVKDLRDWKAEKEGRKPIFFEDIKEENFIIIFPKSMPSPVARNRG